MTCEWHDKIFSIGQNGFQELALEVFRFQYENNPVYNSYVNALGVKPATVEKIEKIPFLPISFFKTDEIKTGKFNAEVVFESSGTTGSISSKHYIKDLSLYEQSFNKGFELFYGSIRDYAIFALLPSYMERQNSSLVYMVDRLIKQTENDYSRFYLNNNEDKMIGWLQLRDHLLSRQDNEMKKNLLLGVTYALIDVAEKNKFDLRSTIIMETGGMKGRREEITRMEVHDILKSSFGVPVIHSEYGMTELLSQAYAKKDGRFQCPPWMSVLIRDEEDPLSVSVPRFQTVSPIAGAINIIDLANVYSCSFIATDDVGRLYPDKSFEVLGRMDGSDLRGCSLLSV